MQAKHVPGCPAQLQQIRKVTAINLEKSTSSSVRDCNVSATGLLGLSAKLILQTKRKTCRNQSCPKHIRYPRASLPGIAKNGWTLARSISVRIVNRLLTFAPYVFEQTVVYGVQSRCLSSTILDCARGRQQLQTGRPAFAPTCDSPNRTSRRVHAQSPPRPNARTDN